MPTDPATSGPTWSIAIGTAAIETAVIVMGALVARATISSAVISAPTLRPLIEVEAGTTPGIGGRTGRRMGAIGSVRIGMRITGAVDLARAILRGGAPCPAWAGTGVDGVGVGDGRNGATGMAAGEVMAMAMAKAPCTCRLQRALLRSRLPRSRWRLPRTITT